MRINKSALLIATLVTVSLPAAAEVTVDWLHLESAEGTRELMVQAAREYEELTPDVRINVQYLENEAFKAKLTTLLQSSAAPDIFYSWGGGVLTTQVEAGVLRPIDDAVGKETLDGIGGAGINAFTREDKLFGLAQQVSQVGFWANKDLLDQAGVAPDELATWDGLLGAVKKLKDSGITPIAVGAQDKWPAHFYWSYLVVRLAGEDEFNSARLGDGEGFAGPAFVEAGERFLELVNLEPFQPGYLASDYTTAAGYFGDGKAALHLMGDWDYTVARENSESGEGLSDDEMLFIDFPSIADGKGDPTDTLGGINGWIFHKDAPDEAVQFMQWYQRPEIQQRFAELGSYIPIVEGSAKALGNPFQQQVSKNLFNAHWHAIFFDQALGADVGGVVNDVSVELADNGISAEEAAEIVKEAVDDSL